LTGQLGKSLSAECGWFYQLTSQSILLWRLAHGSRLDVHELRAL